MCFLTRLAQAILASGLIHVQSAQPETTLSQGAPVIRRENQIDDASAVVQGLTVIVPGVASTARAHQVQSNLAWLASQNVPFQCLIFSYLDAEEFPVDNQVFSPCQSVKHSGFWMDHLKVQIPNKYESKYVLLWLDSVVPDESVDLATMLRVMQEERFQLSSLSFKNRSQEPAALVQISADSQATNSVQASDQPFMTHARGIHSGRILSWVEYQFSIFTWEAFECMQRFVRNESNNVHLGWGVDIISPWMCSMKVGLFDTMTMTKLRHASTSTYSRVGADQEFKELLGRFPSFKPQMPPRVLGYFDIGEIVRHKTLMTRSLIGICDPCVPVGCILLTTGILGLLAMWIHPEKRALGRCLVFFAMQTTVVLFMKDLLVPQFTLTHPTGIPAPFLVAILQQLGAFLLLCVLVCSSWLTKWPWYPKRFTSHQQKMEMVSLAATFSFSLAMGNLSIALLDISVLMTVCSSAPMVALIYEAWPGYIFLGDLGVFSRDLASFGSFSFRRRAFIIALTVVGFLCTVFVISSKAIFTSSFLLGAFACWSCIIGQVLSSSSLKSSKLAIHPFDMLIYMTIPASVLLLVPFFCLPHPVIWPRGTMTDWQVLLLFLRRGDSGLVWRLVWILGGCTLLYSFTLMFVAKPLLPHQQTVTMNMSKLAATGFSLLLGLEALPDGIWGFSLICGVTGSAAAFIGLSRIESAGAYMPGEETQHTKYENDKFIRIPWDSKSLRQSLHSAWSKYSL